MPKKSGRCRPPTLIFWHPGKFPVAERDLGLADPQMRPIHAPHCPARKTDLSVDNPHDDPPARLG